MVWLAETFVKVHALTTPLLSPSTIILWTVYPAPGSSVKVWSLPAWIPTSPAGEIVPPPPADARMVKVAGEEDAGPVWFVSVRSVDNEEFA